MKDKSRKGVIFFPGVIRYFEESETVSIIGDLSENEKSGMHFPHLTEAQISRSFAPGPIPLCTVKKRQRDHEEGIRIRR